jgi:hypothetical protein
VPGFLWLTLLHRWMMPIAGAVMCYSVFLGACSSSSENSRTMHFSPKLVDSVPDATLTPGDTLDVTINDICTPGYARKIRAVPAEIKRRVYTAYHREHESGICCEVDHLIPLELGGSNFANNLWPQYYVGEWNARAKDRLENHLHRMVCTGQIDLATAQHAISANWIAAFQQYVGDSPEAVPVN